MGEIIVRGDSCVFAVDDDPMFQEILQFAYSLSDLQNEFHAFSSGYDCISALETLKVEGKPYPAVILMDINMPGMTGIETVGKIREDANYQDIPIITMLSSSNEDNDIERSMKAGANAYEEKPFDITQLKFVYQAE